MMGNQVKLEKEGFLYDLEYRNKDDDAWYNASVALDYHAQTLVVRHLCSPCEYEVVLSAGGFGAEAQVEELIGRFRPVSVQVQDHECGKLEIGAIVCASLYTGDGDLRFYGSVIEAVDRKVHSFVGGEELCGCTFVLCWLHGHCCGTLTAASIANICTIQNVTKIHPTIFAFATLAKDTITSSKGPSSRKKSRLLETEAGMTHTSMERKSEGSCWIRNHNEWSREDEDIGPHSCKLHDLAVAEGHCFIVINNLEKDLTPLSIKKFVYEHTGILPQVFVFPRLLCDPFARGAILVDCQKKAQIIYEFLDNPNHLIVSSRGRPWVAEKALAGTFATSISNIIPVRLDEMQDKVREGELEIVRSGTEAYGRAKQLRDVLVEYINHEIQVSKKLVYEENRIWRLFNSGEID